MFFLVTDNSKGALENQMKGYSEQRWCLSQVRPLECHLRVPFLPKQDEKQNKQKTKQWKNEKKNNEKKLKK